MLSAIFYGQPLCAKGIELAICHFGEAYASTNLAWVLFELKLDACILKLAQFFLHTPIFSS
jgi:hypothetical protein